MLKPLRLGSSTHLNQKIKVSEIALGASIPLAAMKPTAGECRIYAVFKVRGESFCLPIPKHTKDLRRYCQAFEKGRSAETAVQSAAA